MLLAIRNFIQKHHAVNLEQLSREFRIALDALEPMLHVWINKGLIQKTTLKHCARSCHSCFTRNTPYYEWIPHLKNCKSAESRAYSEECAVKHS